MASQSFDLIGQEEEQELVAFDTRQSRGPTPQSRPNSRLEEMMSQFIISQDATAKSLEATVSELAKSQSEATKSQAEANKSLEAKLSGTDDKLSDIAYKQIEQIAEMSDLVDRMSAVERSLQCSLATSSDPNRRRLTPPGHALMASAPYAPALTTPRHLPWIDPKRPNRPIYHCRQLSLYAEAYA